MPPAFVDIVHRHGRLLELPPPTHGIGGPRTPVALAKVHVDDATDLELDILESDKVLGGGAQYRLTPESQDQRRLWHVKAESSSGLNIASPTLARFLFDENDQELSFQWNGNLPRGANAAGLRYCLLLLRDASRDQSVICALSSPRELRVVSLDAAATTQFIPAPLGGISKAAAQHVQTEVWLDGVAYDGERMRQISAGETVTFAIPASSDSAAANDRLEVDVSLRYDERDAINSELRIEYLVPISVFQDDGRVVTERRAWNLAQFERESQSAQQRRFRSMREIVRVESEWRKAKQELERIRALVERIRQAGSDAVLEEKLLEKRAVEAEELQQTVELQKSAIEHADHTLAWCERMTAFFNEVTGRARLAYRISLQFEDRRVVLVETAEPSGN